MKSEPTPTDYGDGGSLSIAIIGGGVVGIALTLGLIERGFHVRVYERAPDFPEIGVGFAFTEVARNCMAKLSPAVMQALKRVANENQNAHDNYWDGFHQNTGEKGANDEEESNLLFQLPNDNMAWWSCLRSQFLQEMAKSLSPEIVSFNKELVGYDEPLESTSSLTLHFADGTSALADVVIGCDGIRSSVRQQLFAVSHPEACNPSYTHKACYRAVVPMAAAEAALGTSKPHNHCMQTGPRAHVLSYPVAQHTLLNVVVFLHHDEAWEGDKSQEKDIAVPRMTRLGNKTELQKRFTEWRPEVRALIANFPDEPTTWGIFDTATHPVPTYSQNRVCLVGDAAHGSSPHHGAGAGAGMEDALVLATALGMASKESTRSKLAASAAALQAYNDVRYARSRWIVQSSRETGNIYEWMFPGSLEDPVKIRAELQQRQRKISDYDVDGMVTDTERNYKARLGGMNAS